jgi:hypothetical protein
MRKVKDVILPRFQLLQPKYTDDLHAVEVELGERFARVVMGPYLGWSRGRLSSMDRPKLLRKSSSARGGVGTAALGVDEPGGHNMERDDITILVSPSVADKLRVGMGLAGIWVEISRQKVRKEKKAGANPHPRYFYTEALTTALPSFYQVL